MKPDLLRIATGLVALYTGLGLCYTQIRRDKFRKLSHENPEEMIRVMVEELRNPSIIYKIMRTIFKPVIIARYTIEGFFLRLTISDIDDEEDF